MAIQRRSRGEREYVWSADGVVLDVLESDRAARRGRASGATRFTLQEARRLLEAPLLEHVVEAVDSPKDVRGQVLRQEQTLRAAQTINAYSSND